MSASSVTGRGLSIPFFTRETSVRRGRASVRGRRADFFTVAKVSVPLVSERHVIVAGYGQMVGTNRLIHSEPPLDLGPLLTHQIMLRGQRNGGLASANRNPYAT